MDKLNQSLKESLELATEALKRIGNSIRTEFHAEVCMQSRGCHCYENDAERTLASIEAKMNHTNDRSRGYE